MIFKDVLILLPCQSLEDLSLDRSAEDAEELLTAWSAPFHPAIVSIAERTPRWASAEQAPDADGLDDALVFLPKSSELLLPADWLKEAAEAGVAVIRGLGDRDRAVAAALDVLDSPPPPIDPGVVADFYALGFCQFIVELLTRQLRYMSSLDEDQFQRHVVDAAEAAVKGDAESIQDQLQCAFDQLTQAREYFYPNEASFIDLTLVAPTTLGDALAKELKHPVATNLLILGEDLEQMACREPKTLDALKQSLSEETVALAGGELRARPISLMPIEAVLAGLRSGLDSYERLLGQRPKIFGRRRFGLSPLLPQLITKLGFNGALHFSLDAGRLPVGDQSRILWEGAGVSNVEALARVPLDASKTETFLSLPEKLGDIMDLDNGSTLVFAHWPGHACRWYDDLRRMVNYSSVLGRFDELGHYFEESYGGGQPGNFLADQYRSAYLQQAVSANQTDPISRWVKYYRRRTAVEALTGLDILTAMISPENLPSSENEPSHGARAKLFEEIDDALESNDLKSGNDSNSDLDQRIDEFVVCAAADFARVLPRKNAPARPGCLAINPWSFLNTVAIEVPDAPNVPSQKEVPAMGFAWLDDYSETDDETKQAPPPRQSKLKKLVRWRKGTKNSEPLLAEEGLLRNEFFEISFDTATGAIHAIHDYRSRNNRLAQQIALRLPGMNSAAGVSADDKEAAYSVMAVDDLSVTRCDKKVAEMSARGRLVDREAKIVARFSQITRVRRGSRVIELDIEIQPERQPSANPWDSYYAARFAWHDATADIFRDVNSTTQPTDTVCLESPRFIDIRSAKLNSTILTGGLPFHRRFGLRKLDSLLIVKGEASRRFRLGIGIDLPRPSASAMSFLAPATVVNETAAPLANPSGWLFHIDARNVVSTAWEPIVEDGRLAGFAARLLETEGRNTCAHLRCFRSVAQAETTDFLGQDRDDLTVENDRITIDLAAYEWVQIEARWNTRPVTEENQSDENAGWDEQNYLE